MDRISESIRFNERTFRQISFGLVALMMACGAYTLVSLVNRILPEWQPWYLVGLGFFAALERLYTYRRFRDLSLFSKEWAVALGAEWVVLLALVKLVVGLSHGLQTFLAEIPRWWQAFESEFLSPDFLFAASLVFIIWLVSGQFADLLDEMGFAQALIAEEFPALESEKAPVHDRLLSLIFSVGTGLVVLTALVRVDLRAIFSQSGTAAFAEIPALLGGGGSTLLYFMLGLVLLSQTQFIDLHTRWSLHKIPVSPVLAGRWAGYSLVFLGLLAALVSLLPTSYSLGLLYILGYGLSFISSFLFFIGQLIISILLFLFSLPFLLLGQKSPSENVTITPPQFPPPPAEALSQAATPAWWEVLKSMGFWVIFLGILGFSILQYLRQHEEALAFLRKIPGVADLARLWDWLQALFTRAKSGLALALEAGRKRLRTRRTTPHQPFRNGFFNLRRLDPRQKIYFYYLAFLRRSTESGLPRGLSQTPSEFAARLDRALPEAEPEIDALTEAFIEARYTRQTVEPKKANAVKEDWERLRKALRARKVEKSGK
jgi:hypothetical protein